MSNPNTLYPKFVEACLDGSWAGFVANDIKVLFVDSDYTYSASHEFLSDVSADQTGSPSGNLSSKTETNGVADAANLTVAAAIDNDIRGAILYHDSGVAATSRLISYWRNQGDGQPIDVPLDGSDIDIRWSDGTNKIFKL